MLFYRKKSLGYTIEPHYFRLLSAEEVSFEGVGPRRGEGGWGMTSPLVSTTSDLDWWSTTVLDHFAGGGNVPEPCPFLFAFAKICLVSNSIQAEISVESTSIYWFGQISTTSIKKRCELSSVQMVSSAARASSSSLYPSPPFRWMKLFSCAAKKDRLKIFPPCDLPPFTY